MISQRPPSMLWRLVPIRVGSQRHLQHPRPRLPRQRPPHQLLSLRMGPMMRMARRRWLIATLKRAMKMTTVRRWGAQIRLGQRH